MVKIEPFSVNEANDSTGFLLWQVTAIWQRKIAAVLRPHSLTQVQFALLASLLWLSRTENRITQTRLSHHAKLDNMMTSQVLRTLEKKGFLKRELCLKDTRAKILTLTEKGTACVWKVIPEVEKADSDFFNKLNTEHSLFNKSLQSLI